MGWGFLKNPGFSNPVYMSRRHKFENVVREPLDCGFLFIENYSKVKNEFNIKLMLKLMLLKQDIDQNQSLGRRRSTRDSLDKSEIILK